MQVVVPFSVADPKSRLASVLDADERAEFALAMLADVLTAIRETGREPTVLATGPLAVEDGKHLPDAAANVPVRVDDRPLSAAVNGVLTGETPVAIVMADLALATPATVERLFAREEPANESGGEGAIAIAPGRGGGTNALVVRHPKFRVDYHGASVRDHATIAREIGAECRFVDSFRLSADVDEPADLAEVLLHGRGAARDWLVDAGFELAVGEGRVDVSRS